MPSLNLLLFPNNYHHKMKKSASFLSWAGLILFMYKTIGTYLADLILILNTPTKQELEACTIDFCLILLSDWQKKMKYWNTEGGVIGRKKLNIKNKIFDWSICFCCYTRWGYPVLPIVEWNKCGVIFSIHIDGYCWERFKCS